MALKINARNRPKIYGQLEAYLAGVHASHRDAHLSRARLLNDKSIRKLMVDFARDAHHEYLHMVRAIS